jgi:ankyrin repeat protein
MKAPEPGSLKSLHVFVQNKDEVQVKNFIKNYNSNAKISSYSSHVGTSISVDESLIGDIVCEAILSENATIVKTLLKKLSVKSLSQDASYSGKKRSMLYFAAKVGNLEIFKIVLKKADQRDERLFMAEQNTITEQNTIAAFTGALVGNNQNIVKYLLKNRQIENIWYMSNPYNDSEYSLNLNNKLRNIVPLLSYAQQNNQIEIFKLLIENGINIKKALKFNYEKFCEIKKACGENNEKFNGEYDKYTAMTKFFLDHTFGVDLNNLSLLPNNIAEFKVLGLSLKGKVIDLSTLEELQLKGADEAILHRLDIEKIEDLNRRNHLIELFDEAIIKNGSKNGPMTTNEIVNFAPLKAAVKSNQKDIVEQRLLYGASPNEKIKSSKIKAQSLIEFAANNNFNDIVKLLAHDSSIDGSTLLTVLNWAEREKKEEIIKILTPLHTNINEKDKEGITALHNAISNRNLERIEYLVQNGASLSIENNHTFTPLDILFFSRSDDDFIKKVLTFTPQDILFFSKRDNDFIKKVLKIFLDSPGTFNQKMYLATLESTIKRGMVDHVEFLLDYKEKYVNEMSEINNPNIWYAPFIEHVCCRVNAHNDSIWIELTLLLKKHGADFNKLIQINLKNDDLDRKLPSLLFNPLNFVNFKKNQNDAQERSYINKLSGILSLGVDPKISDSQGNTPIHALIKKHAEGKLLNYFSNSEIIEILELFLLHGVDINAQNNEGMTALHIAARGHPKVTQFLLNKNANYAIKNKHDQTPLMLSSQLNKDILQEKSGHYTKSVSQAI